MALSHEMLSELFGLDGQVAIVTGGTGGLGGAMAHGLAQARARGFGEIAPEFEWLATTGRESSNTSQKPASFRWETSMRILNSLQTTRTRPCRHWHRSIC